MKKRQLKRNRCLSKMLKEWKARFNWESEKKLLPQMLRPCFETSAVNQRALYLNVFSAKWGTGAITSHALGIGVESETVRLLEHFPEHLLNSVRPLHTVPHGHSLWRTGFFVTLRIWRNLGGGFIPFLFSLLFSPLFFLRVWHSQQAQKWSCWLSLLLLCY